MAKKIARTKIEEDLGFEPIDSASSEEDLGFEPVESNMPEAMYDFKPQEREIPLAQNIAETSKDVLTTLPQGVTTWADEIQAAAQAGGKKLLGETRPVGEIYREDVSKIRQGVAEARRRSPWATTLGETGVGIGTALIPGVAPVLGAGKFAGIGGMAARGAAEGLGASETLDPYDVATMTGAGAVLGGLGGVASQGMKTLTTQSPEKIRAGVLGARTTQFKEIGIKEREKLAKEFSDMGLFQKTKASFDPDKGKWISQGSTLENVEKPTREKLLSRIDDAFKVTQDKKVQALGKSADKVIDQEVLESELDKVVKKYARKRTGREERLAAANQVKEDIVADILSDLEDEGLDGVTVKLLEASKQRLQEDVGGYGRDPLLAKIPDASKLYNDMYKSINDILRSEVDDKMYSKYNDIQSKLYTAKADLKSAMAAETPTFKLSDVTTWMSSPESQLDVARTAEVLNKPVLKQLKTPLRTVTPELPFETLRLFDPSMPEEKKVLPLINFTPREIIDFRIPRSTQGILENKDKVLAKMVQKGIPDEMLETFTMALNGDPEDVSNIMPIVMSSMPEVFEKSKYKVFDGKFMDPNDRAKAADDISKRDDLNSIQRAKMISKINKTGEVPEGLV